MKVPPAPGAPPGSPETFSLPNSATSPPVQIHLPFPARKQPGSECPRNHTASPLVVPSRAQRCEEVGHGAAGSVSWKYTSQVCHAQGAHARHSADRCRVLNGMGMPCPPWTLCGSWPAATTNYGPLPTHSSPVLAEMRLPAPKARTGAVTPSTALCPPRQSRMPVPEPGGWRRQRLGQGLGLCRTTGTDDCTQGLPATAGEVCEAAVPKSHASTSHAPTSGNLLPSAVKHQKVSNEKRELGRKTLEELGGDGRG